MKRIMILTVATLMVMTLPSFAHANLLSNAGFENGTYSEDGQPTSWWEGTNGWSSWKSGTGHTGTKWVNAGTGSTGPFAHWGQDVAGISAGTQYTLSAYLKTENWGVPVARLQVEFKDSGSALLRTDYVDVLTGINGTWTEYSMTTAAAPSGTTRANFMLLGNNGTVDFDDVNADVIPEPISLLLLGSGLVGLFVLRKKPIK